MPKVKITNPNNVISYKTHEEFIDIVLKLVPKTRAIVVQFLVANKKMMQGTAIKGEEISLKLKGFTFELED